MLQQLTAPSWFAPPFYWGINVCTNGFAGSFTVKPETMIFMVCDLLECLKTWGFKNIFLFNLHGDFKHNLTIVETVKKAYEELGVGAYFITPEFFLQRAGLNGKAPYLIVQPSQSQPSAKDRPAPEYPGIHAGGFETSLMIKDFPELLDIDLARNLKSSRTTLADLKVWGNGGAKAREITPLGYFGNPSEIDSEAAKIMEKEMIEVIPKVIDDFLKREMKAL